MARRLYAVGEGVGLPPESGSAHRYSGRCSLRAGGHHALSCLPYDVFDADLGERRSNGRVSPAKAAINSDRAIAEKLTGAWLPCQESSALQWPAQLNYRLKVEYALKLQNP